MGSNGEATNPAKWRETLVFSRLTGEDERPFSSQSGGKHKYRWESLKCLKLRVI